MPAQLNQFCLTCSICGKLRCQHLGNESVINYKTLHEHLRLQESLGLDKNHVIVDRKDWKYIREQFCQSQSERIMTAEDLKRIKEDLLKKAATNKNKYRFVSKDNNGSSTFIS